MKAGDLKHPISIERSTKITDDRGNRVTVWVSVWSGMASMQDVSGRDFYAAQAHQAQDVVTFGIRWQDGIDTAMRIIYAGQVYEIVQINHLGYKRDYMHIKARQNKAEG